MYEQIWRTSKSKEQNLKNKKQTIKLNEFSFQNRFQKTTKNKTEEKIRGLERSRRQDSNLDEEERRPHEQRQETGGATQAGTTGILNTGNVSTGRQHF